MEQNQNSNQEMCSNNGGANGCVKMSTSSYLCRQSSTRWTPTTEQIKLLKELYYVNGVRSPNADEIQSICARLRRYGKIEGKNVFYWFQNHKARERQKKRLTPNNTTSPNPFIRNNGGLNWKQDHDFALQTKYPNLNNTLPAGVACSTSSGGAQLMGSYGYGAVTMENKFRDCSISGGNALNKGNLNHNFQWSAAATSNYNPYAQPPPPQHYSHFLDKMESDQDHQNGVPEIETLPLFPMHNEDHDHDHDHDHHGFYPIKPEGSDGYYMGGYRWTNNGNNASASLELSLNSYGYGPCYSPNV